MEPITTTGAAIAAAPIVASTISSAFNMMQTNQTNKVARDLANTAHQREVIDLRKAGLNPILSARLGGAAVPQQSAAQMADLGPTVAASMRANAEIEQIRASANAQNSAAQLSQTQARDINSTQQQRIDLLINDANLRLQQKDLTQVQRSEVLQQIENLKAQRQKILVETSAAAQELESKKLKGKIYGNINDLVEGKIPRTIKDFGNRFKNFYKGQEIKRQNNKPKKGERDFSYQDEPLGW